MGFNNLNLHPKILQALDASGYTEPTEIQAKAIPKILKGVDIRASAQTGTGKTAAFLLPALQRLITPSNLGNKGPRLLILVPTRELAMQIEDQTRKYSKFLKNLKSVCIVGGMPYPAQLRKISQPYDILIATPGRLIDFINQKKIAFPRLEMIVLDEADRMFDMGFSDAVEEIFQATPKFRQTLLFSATMQGDVLKLSEKYMNKPMELSAQNKQMRNENISQKLLYVDGRSHKNQLLDHLLSEENVSQAIIFSSTKKHTEELTKEMREKGYHAAALHGDMNQRKRTQTIDKFKKGNVNILVATDVAARGISIKSISHVINFDLPQCAEDYVHRIGRTGRAGNFGTAISFVAKRDIHMVEKIQSYTGYQIDTSIIEGLEPSSKGGKNPSRANNKRKRRRRR